MPYIMKKRVDMSGAAFAITLAIAVMLVCMVLWDILVWKRWA